MDLIHKVYDFGVIAYNSARPLPHYNILKRSIAALMQDSLPLLTHANQGNLCMIWQQNQHILGLRFLQGVRQTSQLLRGLIEPQYIVDFGKNKKCGIFMLICTFHLSVSPKTYSRMMQFEYYPCGL